VRYREQGVDELLQLKLLQAVSSVDVPPPGSTIVLATGDGNVSQFNEEGFRGCVRTALKECNRCEYSKRWLGEASSVFHDWSSRSRYAVARFHCRPESRCESDISPTFGLDNDPMDLDCQHCTSLSHDVRSLFSFLCTGHCRTITDTLGASSEPTFRKAFFPCPLDLI
jgi:hypothetical protein